MAPVGALPDAMTVFCVVTVEFNCAVVGAILGATVATAAVPLTVFTAVAAVPTAAVIVVSFAEATTAPAVVAASAKSLACDKASVVALLAISAKRRPYTSVGRLVKDLAAMGADVMLNEAGKPSAKTVFAAPSVALTAVTVTLVDAGSRPASLAAMFVRGVTPTDLTVELGSAGRAVSKIKGVTIVSTLLVFSSK